MKSDLARRVLHLVPVLLLVSLTTFLLMQLIPGDPAVAALGPDASPERYAEVREELGLDQPPFQRYLSWLGNALTGDLGRSIVPPSEDISDMILARLPVTLQITVMAIVIALLLAVPAALFAAYRAGGRFDRAMDAIAFGALSLPSFLVGLLLVFFVVFRPDMVRAVLLLGLVVLTAWLLYRVAVNSADYSSGPERLRYVAVRLGGVLVLVALSLALLANWPDFPRQGFVRLTSVEGPLENLRHAFLPAFALAMVEFGVFVRVLRSDLIATLQEDFILAARAKGTPTWLILLRDALRPSSFSLITVAGVALGRLIGGTVIVESIFNLPGMGTMILRAISDNDFAVVQASVLVIAVFYVVTNAAVDTAYSTLDPRTRRARV